MQFQGLRMKLEITLNTLLMNQVLKCFFIIITYGADFSKPFPKAG